MRPKRILVVDDEPDVAAMTSAMLAQQGYETIATTSPYEALQTVEGGRIDLILSDVMMPDMNGPELIFRVQEHSPMTAAVLMSGFSSEDPLPPGIPFIPKPFTVTGLLSVISQALQESEERAKVSCDETDPRQL